MYALIVCLVVPCGLVAGVACTGSATSVSTNQASNERTNMSQTQTKTLADKLLAGDYGVFFYYPQHEMTINRIWSEPTNPPALEALVADIAAPTKARFLAAEVLFTKDVFFLERVGRPLLAALYAEALVKMYTGHANSWGLLWIDNDVGEVGSRFLVLGDAAVSSLIALLDVDTVVTHYEGSEEATLGNGARYRIKDFAAYYLGRITQYPIPFHSEPSERDVEIARLREHLAKRPASSRP